MSLKRLSYAFVYGTSLVAFCFLVVVYLLGWDTYWKMMKETAFLLTTVGFLAALSLVVTCIECWDPTITDWMIEG